jgi:hypothetical protein
LTVAIKRTGGVYFTKVRGGDHGEVAIKTEGLTDADYRVKARLRAAFKREKERGAISCIGREGDVNALPIEWVIALRGRVELWSARVKGEVEVLAVVEKC